MTDSRGRSRHLDRRAAALLASLAMSGPASKYSLACQLWPEASHDAVRANMRQLLRRIRVLAGEDVVEGDADRLCLAQRAWVDVGQLRAAAVAGRHAEVLALSRGRLLHGMELEECAELALWLEGARSTVDTWCQRARREELRRLEAKQEWLDALAVVNGWVQAEPESEEAARAQMRLNLLRGERGAALVAFQRLKATLARELEVRPTPETLALAREIEQSASVPPSAGPETHSLIPLRLQRPPLLVGRDEAWWQLERACETGRLALLVGEPGIGKTRLAEEVAEARGARFRTEGRAGDATTPFAALARMLRALLVAYPRSKLPAWSMRALGRVLPELGAGDEASPALGGGELQLRLAHAVSELLWKALSDYRTVFIDDLHHWDVASLELLSYALLSHDPRSSVEATGARPHVLICYSPSALSATGALLVQRLVAADKAAPVRLVPLTVGETQTLLRGLGVAGVAAYAERIAVHTGGNPRLVLELVRHQLAAGVLEEGWAEPLPVPEGVGLAVQHRLQALSPGALLLAQAAALAGPDFSLGRLAQALRKSVADVLTALQELESAQLSAGDRLSTPLVCQAIGASIPQGRRALLQELMACVLGAEGKEPLLAGDPRQLH